ncbi:ABC transporter ATP-binding protein [Flavobacterium oreochromis]|uniref:ABC transporter ATP-binding protein n=1 Tax=Flavobacterium oreochromis TaxID=2906078 RepID=UPI0038593EE2
MNSLIIKNLQKAYSNGVQALQDVSLEITNGMFGLLGPNGAGKSSLMRTIVGLQGVDSGEIYFNGVNVLENPKYLQERLGFLPQDFGVYPKVSAYDLLNHLAILKGVSDKKERKNQILALLEKVNLTDHRNKEVATFSGGMRQRFGVAQALLGNPSIIIVDEPTAGLDPEERNRFNGLLAEIGNEKIIILSTHLVEDVQHLCAQMAIIKSGKVILQGSPNALVRDLEGKIWRKQISPNELTTFQKDYQMISSQYAGGQLYAQVVSEAVLPRFESVQPTLEEVYFYQLHTNTTEK